MDLSHGNLLTGGNCHPLSFSDLPPCEPSREFYLIIESCANISEGSALMSASLASLLAFNIYGIGGHPHRYVYRFYWVGRWGG